MKSISAADFILHWISLFEHITSQSAWIERWNSNTKWSELILGTKKSSTANSPIGEYFKTQYQNLRYRTEDGLFDLTMTLANNIDEIPTLGKHYEHITFKLPDKEFYPVSYDILLEHENDIYSSWNEIAKLTYVRGYLKVLVTYNSDTTDNVRIEKENQMIFRSAKKIIGDSNAVLRDNDSTEYLILIGRKLHDKLTWTSKTYKFDGMEI